MITALLRKVVVIEVVDRAADKDNLNQAMYGE